MNQLTALASESKRRIAFNMACSATAHILSAAIAFIITPFLIARVGLEAYGFYPISAELLSFFGLFGGIINATAARYVTVEDARNNQAEAKRYFSSVFFANLALSLILLIPMGLFVALLDRFLSVPPSLVGELRLFFALTLATVPIHAISSAFGSTYSVTNRLDLRSAQELIAVLLKAAVLFSLLGGGFSSSIVSIGIALLVSTVCGAIIQILMCRRLTPELSPSLRHLSLSHLCRVAASGFWYTLDRLGAFLMTGGLLLLSNMLFTADGVGVYSVSMTASRALCGGLLMLASIFLPVTAKRYARGEYDRLRADVIRDQKITGFFAAVGVAFAVGFCDEFFHLWLGNPDPRLRVLTVLSLLPTVAIASALPLINLGVIMNRMRRLSLLFVAGGLLTLAAVILVSCFTEAGVLGVAALSAAAQLLWYTVAVPLFSARILKTRLTSLLLPMLRAFGACLVTVGIILTVKSVAPADSWLRLGIIGAVCLVAGTVSSFLVVFGKPKFKI